MAKRKQPEPSTDELIPLALGGSAASEEQGPSECAKPVAGTRLTAEVATGTVIGNPLVGDPAQLRRLSH